MKKPPTTETIRAVWAALTARPSAPVRAIAAQLGCGYSTVAHAVRALDAAGYVAEVPGTSGTRRVLVPFVASGLAVSRPGWPVR